MPIILKSASEIARLREAGRLVAETYELLRPHVQPGVSTGELDKLAEDFILSRGAEILYKGYILPNVKDPNRVKPFPGTICTAINDVICHGIPSTKARLRNGDIIGIDIGLRYQGWVGDSCVTFAVGQVDEKTQHLLDTTYHSLELGIEQARVGNTLGDVGAAIQQYAEAEGFSVVLEYGGHGVGRSLHEEPDVPHHGKPRTGLPLRTGMVFTIEPMLNVGKPQTRLERDGWTVRTADGSRSAQFEHTIAVTNNGPVILTCL